MSRPSTSRPTSRPSGGSRPNLNNRPSGGSRPDLGNRPGGGNRPNFGNNSGGGNRPNLGNRPGNNTRPGNGNRPDFGSRPSQGQLQDFLHLPGNSGSDNRPGAGNRPEIGNGSNIVNRPGSGNRPDIGNRPGNGNRPDIVNRPGDGNRPGNVIRPGNGNRPDVVNRPGSGDRNNVNIRNNRGPRKNDISINQINQNNVRVGNNVRNNWNGRHVNAFNRSWWSNRPGWNSSSWRFQHGWGRYPAGYWWRPVTAVAMTGWFTGWWNTPSYYDYGENIYYQDNSVYYGDQPVATADEYYQQAVTLADSVPENAPADDKSDWMPLGVYAITNADSEETNMILQLAVSKEGVIAGTFYNDITQVSHPVEGMVEKENQRASWHFSDGSNPNLVMETGIYNLTKDQTDVLVHFNAEKTQTWMLVRLPEPEGDGNKTN
tara:strand:+ start:12565 stop:13854 length:1290 start_codon:yes stop_codon:yes gene_type:complete